MSRNRRVSGGGNMASSLMAVDRILSKEREYRDAVEQNHAMSKMLAEMIAIQGELETSMLEAATDPALKQDIEKSLQEQRERLKKISEKNVQSERDVDSFLGALNAVRNQVQAANNNGNAEPPDYERIISTKMEEHSAAQAANQLELRDEEMCREIRNCLGEKERAARGNAQDEDSDDDLEVLRNPTGTESLKCPITAMLYVEPLRNKVCRHVYSKQGIEHLLRGPGAKACPVAGCRNTNVTMAQLEEDMETAMKVRRHKRREEQERAQRASQAILDDDSDEEVL